MGRSTEAVRWRKRHNEEIYDENTSLFRGNLNLAEIVAFLNNSGTLTRYGSRMSKRTVLELMDDVDELGKPSAALYGHWRLTYPHFRRNREWIPMTEEEYRIVYLTAQPPEDIEFAPNDVPIEITYDKLSAESTNQKLFQEYKELFMGNFTLTEIAGYLEKYGERAKRGRQFDADRVRELILSLAQAGLQVAYLHPKYGSVYVVNEIDFRPFSRREEAEMLKNAPTKEDMKALIAWKHEQGA